MTIDIRYTTSEPNRIQKSILTLKRLEGSLRAESTIIDPEILIEGDISDVASANYLTIYEFHRHYFIRNIESVRTNLYIIYAHVDVLTSYAEAIMSNTAIIYRQAKDWNLYLDDGAFKVYQNPIIETHPFPSGFSSQMYVLAVTG